MLNKGERISVLGELSKKELYTVQGGEYKMGNLLGKIKEFIGNLFGGNKENSN